MALTKGQKAGVGLGVVAVGTAIYLARKAMAAPKEYCCLYCSKCFKSYAELVDHVIEVHPGERIPIEIEWD